MTPTGITTRVKLNSQTVAAVNIESNVDFKSKLKQGTEVDAENPELDKGPENQSGDIGHKIFSKLKYGLRDKVKPF